MQIPCIKVITRIPIIIILIIIIIIIIIIITMKKLTSSVLYCIETLMCFDHIPV